jgi:hypothetical protein
MAVAGLDCSWRMRADGLEPLGPSNHQWPKSSASKGEQRMGGMVSLKPEFEGLVDEVDEVGGVAFDALGGLLGVVGLLVAHVDVGR